jgi:hypothetical protein
MWHDVTKSLSYLASAKYLLSISGFSCLLLAYAAQQWARYGHGAVSFFACDVHDYGIMILALRSCFG